NSLLWGLFNIVIWLVFSVSIYFLMKVLQTRAEKILLIRFVFERPIDIPKFEAFLREHKIKISDVENFEGKTFRTVRFFVDGNYKSFFDNHKVSVEMTYDSFNGFLYNVDMEVYDPKRDDEFFKKNFVEMLNSIKIFRN
ncbi:MAG: hypothetical protein ACTSRA_10505, partial [Promethearchaeota archaeon]